MEEKKLKETKKKDSTSKLTYEQLNETCMQLYQQNQMLAKQLQQANLSSMFKRLDYLFLALKYVDVINDDAFIDRCVMEIKDALTPPDEVSKEENHKTN